jgi:hypothetical protein
MFQGIGEDRQQIDNKAKLLHDTLSRKVYPWVANEYLETEWEELVHSFSLASKQLDDLNGDLRSVYSMQVPTPKKPFPPNQYQIPQILSTMVDKEDKAKILSLKGSTSSASTLADKANCEAHNQAIDRVLGSMNKSIDSMRGNK